MVQPPPVCPSYASQVFASNGVSLSSVGGLCLTFSFEESVGLSLHDSVVWTMSVLWNTHSLFQGYETRLHIPPLRPINAPSWWTTAPFHWALRSPSVTGAIKVFQPWANAAVTSVYCCISQAWISEVPQLSLLCCGYCAQLCTWFPQYSQCGQLLTGLTLIKLAVECPVQWFKAHFLSTILTLAWLVAIRTKLSILWSSLMIKVQKATLYHLVLLLVLTVFSCPNND